MSQPEQLAAAQKKREEMAAKGIKPTIINNPVTKCFAAEKPSWRLSINAFCATCMGCSSELQGPGYAEHMEQGFRHMIRDCPSTACPLHHWRPFQEKKS